MVSRKDYQSKEVKAAHAVLLELTNLLGEYRDDIVLVGGWVPELLLSDPNNPHVGSTDVDLALNHKTLKEAGYRTIRQLLDSKGYRPGDQPFVFVRTVRLEDGSQLDVKVDFLSGEYEGTGKSHRHQKIQEIRARKARGCDLAFEKPVEIIIEGQMPNGGKNSACVRVAAIVPFLMMKAIALRDRLKEKDAWDIVYCIKRFPGGAESLAKEFLPHIKNKLVIEGVEILSEKFKSTEHLGCKSVADFEEVNDPDETARLKRDAFEQVNALLSFLV